MKASHRRACPLSVLSVDKHAHNRCCTVSQAW